MRRILLAPLILLCGCLTTTQWLTDTPAISPIVAEPRASMMKVVIGGYSPYAFQQTPGSTNIGMDLSVGKEIAIVNSTDASVDQVPLKAGQQRYGLWFPVSFHMLWDLNDASNAIVNTDYRFGGIVKYERGLKAGSFANEVGFRYTPLMHESTHLGDELTLAGQRRNPTTFERINPSQFFTELLGTAAWYQDARGQHRDRTFARAGLDVSYTSLYGADTEFTRNHRTIPGASSRVQPIVQVEHVFGRWIPEYGKGNLPSIAAFEPFISTDIRRSIVFNYEKARTSDPDNHTVSVNIIAGIRRADRVTRKGVSDFFLRIYHGVNPNGQFRNNSDFWLVGIGLALDP